MCLRPTKSQEWAFCGLFYLQFSKRHADAEKGLVLCEIALMRNIYRCTIENEEFCWKSYKLHGEGRWHDYGNPEFELVEELYSKGRDFFITLKDVGNAVSRMEDYMKEETKTTHVEDNSIHMGDGNKIKNSLFGNRINENKKESFFHKYIWQIVAAIIAGIAVACICMWIGIK